MRLSPALTRSQWSHVAAPRRLAGRVLRPLPLLAAVGGVLVLFGDALAIIAGCGALLMALDRAWPVGSGALSPADASFTRLARARRREELLRRVRGRVCTEERLLCLREDRGWIAVAERRQLGVQPIHVDSIVGTVEPNKAYGFDSRFRPQRRSRERWTQIWKAAQRGAPLPPISVYRIADRHFVRDGHHRVSVATALATVEIDADVVELRPARATSVISPAFDGYRRWLGASAYAREVPQ